MTISTTPEPLKRLPLPLTERNGAPQKKRKVTTAPITPPASPPALHLSFLEENFTTMRKLGSGCFGDVRAVRSRNTHEEFALKEAKVDKLKVKTGFNFTKDQLKEIRIHKSLGFHPNIVTFLQAWREDRSLYLLMELCEMSLEEHWSSKGTLRADDIDAVMNDMLLALQHLGAANIGHFDLKPANILRTSEGSYKLADFTVASQLDQIQKDNEFGDGTYAAPELLNDQFTLKADVYSLGLTLAEISVPCSTPLTSSEWTVFKQDAQLPARVAQALSFSIELPVKVPRMIERDHYRRASVEELLNGKRIDPIEAELARHRMETARLRLAAHQHRRLSMPAGVERAMRESKSPLAGEKAGPLFDNDEGFFTMPSPVWRRLSMGRIPIQGSKARRSGGLKFNLDD